MKFNNSKKLVWKYKCIPFYWSASIFAYSSPCIIFLIPILIGILIDYRGFSDIINIIILIPIILIFPFYLLLRWGRYFFFLKAKTSRFSIKPKLLAFKKRFDLSEIKSIEFLLKRARHLYSNSSHVNLLSIYTTITIKEVSEKTHTFNIIRFYNYKTNADIPFVEKRKAMKSLFINALEDLRCLFPDLILIKDEIQEEFEIVKKKRLFKDTIV
ncbi:MAG: hypothetical protein EU529_11450 [Promethearchaeota archaeon]|nr:MAG: hypothetical protein EU529_11450 [Candidatus Lokiarchaeota archaeon]